jgi:hypothetical protein
VACRATRRRCTFIGRSGDPLDGLDGTLTNASDPTSRPLSSTSPTSPPRSRRHRRATNREDPDAHRLLGRQGWERHHRHRGDARHVEPHAHTARRSRRRPADRARSPGAGRSRDRGSGRCHRPRRAGSTHSGYRSPTVSICSPAAIAPRSAAGASSVSTSPRAPARSSSTPGPGRHRPTSAIRPTESC